MLSCSAPPSAPTDTLRIRISNDPATLDPRKSSDFVSATLIGLLYEGLTRCLPDGSSEMGVAERVEISKDGKRYVFYLRKSYWSDGVAVTAHDFEASWKQILSPGHPLICSYLFYPILNAEAAVKGKKSLEEVGIRALNESTLEILLERPTPYFLSLTSFPSFFPAPQHQMNSIDTPIPGRVSNGPFLLTQIKSQSSLSFIKNPTFWNHESIKLEGISIIVIPNDMTALEMFERGELDWLGGHLSGIPPDALLALQDKLQYFPMAATTFCTFNTHDAPFSNEHMRRAFSLALDRAEIAREIFPTDQNLASRYIPPSLCGGRNKNLFPSFNPMLAQEHLRLAETELGHPITSVAIHYRTGVTDGRIAQVLKQMWETALGIEVQMVQTDAKTHKDYLHRRAYEIALSSWIAQYTDPINILERFKSCSNAKNYCHWEDPDFANLLTLAQETPDPIERTELLERAEELMAAHIPILPLYHWSNPSLSSSRVRNIQTTPGGGTLFERCWIENDP